ncbi:hypothetical protein JHD48_02285 [Sulfurimonas sp. SAG-AH-194-I05]|nr:hypothetical protein [Sulfurimonas sp. SAG-AH-194-I05]MDF1874557.1 hypothetical protein [Sulfurimonas sp. SAG-AH-194-I05]
MSKKVDVLLIALSSPIQIGIYENNQCIDVIKSTLKSSDILPTLYKEIFNRYIVENLFFANGPGSFMAIKVSYIFLKSLSILKQIPLFATDAFYFNKNEPIKAMGKLCFVKMGSEIKTQKLEIAPSMEFKIPAVLDYNEFSTTVLPNYNIGAVG